MPLYCPDNSEMLSGSYRKQCPDPSEICKLCFYVNFFENDFIMPADFAKDNIECLNWIIEFTKKRIKSFSSLHSSLNRSRLVVKHTKNIFSLFKNNMSEAELKSAIEDIIRKTRNEFRKLSKIES